MEVENKRLREQIKLQRENMDLKQQLQQLENERRWRKKKERQYRPKGCAKAWNKFSSCVLGNNTPEEQLAEDNLKWILNPNQRRPPKNLQGDKN